MGLLPGILQVTEGAARAKSAWHGAQCRRPPAQLPAKPPAARRLPGWSTPRWAQLPDRGLSLVEVGKAEPCGTGAPGGAGPACYSPAPSELDREASRGAQGGVAGQRPRFRSQRSPATQTRPQWLQVLNGEPPAHGPSKASDGQAALWEVGGTGQTRDTVTIMAQGRSPDPRPAVPGAGGVLSTLLSSGNLCPACPVPTQDRSHATVLRLPVPPRMGGHATVLRLLEPLRPSSTSRVSVRTETSASHRRPGAPSSRRGPSRSDACWGD